MHSINYNQITLGTSWSWLGFSWGPSKIFLLHFLEIFLFVVLFNSDGRDEAEEPETGGEDVARDAGQGRHRGRGQGRPG